MWVTEFGMITLANVSQPSKALSQICVSVSGISTTSSSSGSTMPPRRAIAFLLEHITTFCLKTTLTTGSSAIPASNTFASLASNRLPPTMISITVVLRVSSSQVLLSLIWRLSARPVVFGVTSRTMTSPFGCRAETFLPLGTHGSDYMHLA